MEPMGTVTVASYRAEMQYRPRISMGNDSSRSRASSGTDPHDCIFRPVVHALPVSLVKRLVHLDHLGVVSHGGRPEHEDVLVFFQWLYLCQLEITNLPL